MPVAVDQAASLCSCGHEIVGRPFVPASMNGTITKNAHDRDK
jgi:hypothetical protein